MLPRLIVFMLLGMGMHLTACAQQPEVPSGGTCGDPFADVEQLRFDPSAWETNFCRHSVPYEEIRSGGPPRDGIPPIDDPPHVSAAQADRWLAPEEPVIRLTQRGAARAYPLQILVWHEIVNDRLGGTPVAVTFCPLCYTAIAFKRPRVDGERLTFGTTGNLRHSDLVMWDRATESWWQQYTGEAIVGKLTGRQLEVLPSAIVSWQTFKQRHPSGTVLSRETDYDRAYAKNPYVGYDDASKSPLLYEGPVDDKRKPMARVVGVTLEDRGRAYPLDVLRAKRAVNDTLAGTPLVVLWRSGTASALDRAQVAGGKDIGQTGVFRRTLAGRTLTFQPRDDSLFVDRQTGSTWTVLGEAVAGPLKGKTLEALPHHDTFWFVWSAFQSPEALYEAGSSSTDS